MTVTKSNQKKTVSNSSKHKQIIHHERYEEDKDIFQKLNQTLDLNKPNLSRDYLSIFSTPQNKANEHFKFNSALIKPSKAKPFEPYYSSNKIDNESVSPYKQIPQPSLMVIIFTF